MSGGGGSKTQTVTQKSDINPNIAPFVYGDYGFLQQAANLSNQPLQAYQGQTVAPLNGNQNAGINNLISGASNYQQLANQGGSAARSLLAGRNSSMDLAGTYGTNAAQGLNSFINSGTNGQSYDPQAQILGFANANPTLQRFLLGNEVSPYLDQTVSAAQTSGQRAFQDSTDIAARGYANQIAPQIQQAQNLIPQAVQQFQQQILPSIRRNSLSSGTYGGSRESLAEGLAASNLGGNLATTLGNLAQTATTQGNQTAQDILRNQQAYTTDQGNIAANIYGGAYNNSQSNALQAAGISAGLQGNAQNALLQNSQLGANLYDSAQNRALQASQSGLSNVLSANQLGLQQQATGLQGIQGLQGGYTALGSAQLQGGALQQQQAQQQLQAQIDRYNFAQQEPLARLQNYAALVSPLAGAGGIQTSSQQLPKANPLSSAAGGALAGYGATGNPYGALIGGGLGLATSFF